MKKIKYIFCCLLILSCSSSEDSPEVNNDPEVTPPEPTPVFYTGMDLSFQAEIETYNVNYRNENGTVVDLLDFVSNNGNNLVRLKLWHTPQDGQNGLSDVKSYAQRIKANGMAFLLNFHYSDYWADPNTQTPPVAWQNMTDDEIRVAIYEYTKDVVTQLKDQNTLPEIIQIGNETDSGFLWDYGKVWNEFSDNWGNYAALVREAIRAVREVDTEGKVQIMLHNSSIVNAEFYFNELAPYTLDYDMIGLSYYPQFHSKNLTLITSKLNRLAEDFEKEIMIVEIAYPFTLDWNDNSTNWIGSTNQIISDFPPTPEGQKSYLQWWVNTIKNIPNNKGIGFCYWAPDWVAFSGNENTSTSGSVWENQCLFDFDIRALPAFDVYRDN